MHRRILIATAAVFAAAGLWVGGQTLAAQVGAPCLVNVPQAWGEYRGHAQGHGFVFQDGEGTLRIVRQLPCGLEGPPAVAVIMRRR